MLLQCVVVNGLPLWPNGPKRDCYARGLGFDSQVEQKVLLELAARS